MRMTGRESLGVEEGHNSRIVYEVDSMMEQRLLCRMHTIRNTIELFTHYHDWLIESCTEEIFDCMSSGIPHQHAVNRVIARKNSEKTIS